MTERSDCTRTNKMKITSPLSKRTSGFHLCECEERSFWYFFCWWIVLCWCVDDCVDDIVLMTLRWWYCVDDIAFICWRVDALMRWCVDDCIDLSRSWSAESWVVTCVEDLVCWRCELRRRCVDSCVDVLNCAEVWMCWSFSVDVHVVLVCLFPVTKSASACVSVLLIVLMC
jgi:hypothetical protein